MNDTEFFAFIKKILENGSQTKSVLSLNQFKKILELQGAENKYIESIDIAVNAIPEAKELAKSSTSINANDLKIAQERARVRKQREEMASHYSRCG